MPIAEPSEPLGDEELEPLFRSLTATRRIALAVSGGADSLALLDAVDRWRRRRGNTPDVVVLTVDHGLRPSSAGEARMVARVARRRGMKARVLVAAGPPPQSDIEAAARAARYRLLLAAARKAGASHLLLAHHRDDLAETLLMRLARGAGVFGLAGMRGAIALDGAAIGTGQALTILRPFLEVPRARLAATARAAGFEPVEDEMNADPRFTRARVRRLLPHLAAEGLDPAGLAAAARRLAGAAEALDAWAGRLIGCAVALDDLAVARLDPTAFFAAPEEIRLRVLTRLLSAIGGEGYPPRFERLAGLLTAMAKHPGAGRFKRTLAGCVVEARGGRFAFYREVGRAGLPSIKVGPGFSGVWDHRFAVEIGEGAPDGLILAALTEAGRRAVGVEAGAAGAGALAALPAIRRGASILAVPSLAFTRARGRPFVATARSLLPARLAEAPLFPDHPART